MKSGQVFHRGQSPLVLAVALLCGCTVLVTEPERPALDKIKDGISFDDAFAFLRSAQAQVNAGQSQLDQFSQGTVGAVGVGTGGAALATLAHAHRDVPMGLLALASMSYTLNQTSNIKAQSAIYGAARKRLDCIEQTGYVLHQAIGTDRPTLRAQHKALSKALAKLGADLASARSSLPMSAGVTTLLPKADAAYKNGHKVDNSIAAFLQASDVGQQIYAATLETLRVANEQLRANSADATAAATAGTVLRDFASEHAKLLTAANAAAAAASTPSAHTQGADPMAELLLADLAEVYRIVALAQSLMPASSAMPSASVSSCLSNVGPQGNVILEPNEALSLTIGGDPIGFLAYTDARQQLAFDFLGVTPQAKDLSVSNQGGSKFSLAAPPGAKATQYTLYFYRTDDKDKIPLKPSLLITVGETKVEVVAAPPASPAPKPGAAPPGLSFSQRRKLIGLDTSISAETDAKWVARVQKLNTCFGFPPGDGVLYEKLSAALQKSEDVNSAGDCPKPKAATPTPTPAPGPTGTTTPIPPPPSLGANAASAASAASK